MRTFFVTSLLFFFFSLFPFSVYAQESIQTDVIVFVRQGCQHCADEETYLTTLSKAKPEIRIVYYRLENAKDKAVWNELTTRLKLSKVTPLTVVGHEMIVGFSTAETTGKEILNLISAAQKEGIKTDISHVRYDLGSVSTAVCPEDGSTPCAVQDTSPVITVPFIGRINTGNYPLILLSVILGFIDGFNPCAMWVLVTFLLILLQVGSRKKMFLFAGTFILAETVMYYLIMTVWFTTWDFVQLDTIVTPVVGLVAIGAGCFFLYEWRQKEIACKVTNIQQRAKTRKRIEELVLSRFTLMTFLGILGIAFSVNIIEFACSIGIPQTFTKILEMNALGFWKSQLYIFIYIFFYMIDDFVVFGIGLYGAEKLSLTTKYSKMTNLLGGILMILLGLLLLLKPSVFLLV